MNINQPGPNFLNVNVNGYFNVGCGTCSPSYLRQNNFQFADDLDIIRGRHHITVGGEWVHYRFDLQLGSLANGTFTFNGQSTNDPLLDFMLGLPETFIQGTFSLSMPGRTTTLLTFMTFFGLTKDSPFRPA